MLGIYRFEKMRFLVRTIIFASICVAMMTGLTQAQTISAIRQAVESNGRGSRLFLIDSSGGMSGDNAFALEITRLDNSGSDSASFVGKYYRSGKSAPASTNVTGSINIVRGAIALSAIRISFNVTESMSIPSGGSLINETVFVGALKLTRMRKHQWGFMAGTYEMRMPGEVGGPFPFCATLTSLPPG